MEQLKEKRKRENQQAHVVDPTFGLITVVVITISRECILSMFYLHEYSLGGDMGYITVWPTPRAPKFWRGKIAQPLPWVRGRAGERPQAPAPRLANTNTV